MYGMCCSNEEAKSSESTEMSSGFSNVGSLSLQGHESLLIFVPVVSDIWVHDVCSERLHAVVELVSVQVGSGSFKSKVRPVGHLDTVLVLVVLNEGKSVFEGLSVEKGVQSVLRGAQDASGTSHTRVLLLGQVLYNKAR